MAGKISTSKQASAVNSLRAAALEAAKEVSALCELVQDSPEDALDSDMLTHMSAYEQSQ